MIGQQLQLLLLRKLLPEVGWWRHHQLLDGDVLCRAARNIKIGQNAFPPSFVVVGAVGQAQDVVDASPGDGRPRRRRRHRRDVRSGGDRPQVDGGTFRRNPEWPVVVISGRGSLQDLGRRDGRKRRRRRRRRRGWNTGGRNNLNWSQRIRRRNSRRKSGRGQKRRVRCRGNFSSSRLLVFAVDLHRGRRQPRLVPDGQDVAEDVVVGLHPLGGPKAAATVQRQELERPWIGNRSVGGSPELHFGGNRMFDLYYKNI